MSLRIIGAENMSGDEVNLEISQGAKFVIFEYCISIIIMTFKRSSDIYFIKSGERTAGKSIGFTLLTLLLGWWGFPFGPIYTIGALCTNLRGGKDVTNKIVIAPKQEGRS